MRLSTRDVNEDMKTFMVAPRNVHAFALVAATVLGLTLAQAQQQARLSVSVNFSNEVVIAIQPAFHVRFGCMYPMTYQIGIPGGSSGFKAERRRSHTEAWEVLPEKFSNNLFNAIEAVRFDYARDRALVSAAFTGESDSLFIRITGASGPAIEPRYEGISRFYDDRRAAVTVTGDDCADWSSALFPPILSVFRSYGLYVTVGIITGNGWCSAPTWQIFQKEVDSGYVELASHSRTHSYLPYADPLGEVQGSVVDILDNVQLPSLFASLGRHYVYVWIAPYGDYDATVDSLLDFRGYLITRGYTGVGDTTFSRWEEREQHFAPMNPTLEIGAPGWGGGTTDTTFLNGTFDAVVAQGRIYHFMWHPQVINGDLDKPYFLNHLHHVSNRSDIWYVNFGHLYLYHLLQQSDSSGLANVIAGNERPAGLELWQNYPNPFNPSTTIEYRVSGLGSSWVRLAMYDILGREAAVLVNERKAPGDYLVRFDAGGLASGVYFYRLVAGAFSETRRLLLVR